MARSNLAVLTSSHHIIASKKRAKKEQPKEVVFDESARREFLTGFHKRKLAKKEAAKKKALEREKQERLEARREKRQMLAQKAAENAAQVEKAYGGQVEAREDEWDGIDEDTTQADECEEEYEDEEQLATVTVIEDFDPEELLHGPATARQPQDDAEELAPLILTQKQKPAEKIKKSAVAGAAKSRTKVTKKAKNVKYQTNAARKMERAKQQKRKVEKAERAGGKSTRKKTAHGRR